MAVFSNSGARPALAEFAAVDFPSSGSEGDIYSSTGTGAVWVPGGPPAATLAPSHPGYPQPVADSRALPGPVARTVRVVRRGPADEIGWAVHNDDLTLLLVKPDGPAAAAGLEQGSRIAAVNGRAVHGVDQLRAAVTGLCSFTVTVETGRAVPQQEPMPASTVVVHGITHPPEATLLNGQRGVVTDVRGGLAAVQIPGRGTVGLPLSNMALASAHEDEWREVASPEVGRVYYWNTATGETTWDHPLAEVLPPGLEEVQMVKGPNESLGLKLEEMVVTGVRDDSPADRCNVQQYLGWRLTHIDGERAASTNDVAALTAGKETARLRFEVVELAVQKEPDQGLGCELRNMLLCGVVPGGALDRAFGGHHSALGQRLTHVNGVRVFSLEEVAERTAGCETVHLRFEPEEVVVNYEPSEPLGLQLDGMRLQGCEPGSAAKRAGVSRFVGRLLTHVDGKPVHNIEDVATAVGGERHPALPVGLLLRFETAAEEEHRLERATAAPTPPRAPIEAAEESVFDSPLRPPLPAVVPRGDALRAAAGFSPPRPDTAVARLWAPPRLGAAPATTAAAPPATLADACCVCKGPPEIDCFECAAAFCRQCCLKTHCGAAHGRGPAGGAQAAARPGLLPPPYAKGDLQGLGSPYQVC
eukprot:TRINITY_DN56242_c0_g1_i1.p1 TRINITY_DN56242_c0_g1~~TRINITY_DN56242_c0_g1_i1.p1  ORF type:complete len:671 (+),score=168.93 TRINITY_DN56242_c0_g1_i1:86-2014(+)